MGYAQNRQLSDRYLSHAKTILSQILLIESSYEEDTQHATDLIVLTIGGAGKIACRFRQSEYFYKSMHPEYRQQFTVRSRLDSGSETEFSKIMRGFCDLMFYGFMAADKKRFEIDWWVLISLHAFREQVNSGTLQSISKDNHDGTHFQAYDITTAAENPPLLFKTNIQELKAYESNMCYMPTKADAVVRRAEPLNRRDEAMDMLRNIHANVQQVPLMESRIARIEQFLFSGQERKMLTAGKRKHGDNHGQLTLISNGGYSS